MLKITIEMRRRTINLPESQFQVIEARFRLPDRDKERVGSFADTDEVLKELRRLINTRL